MNSTPDILESPEEVLTTLRSDGRRRWLYPTLSPGRFLNARRAVGWVLIVAYIALPIVQIGGYPAVLLDVVQREFAFFGLVFYPTDTVLLMAFLIGIIAFVILGTAVLGRVWCGWGCPQTVYLEFVFRPIERLLEGKEHVRKRRDEGRATWDRAWRKSVKWLLFLAVSAVLAHTFVAYFVGWSNLLEWMTGDPREHWGFFVLMAGTTGMVLFDFGVFREQMCTITCPYARMQSVLLDPDSLIVSYDPTRGEPRARRSKAKLAREAQGLDAAKGDCIDCFACVRTCPTGIDIRDGLQMECIACTQCIDACDSIMERIDRPAGLIRYTSENELAGGRTRLLRPRTILYTLLLLIALSAFTGVVVSRTDYDVNIGRVSGAPYTILPDGHIANRLRFRVRNQIGEPSSFDIAVVSPASASLRPIGALPIALDTGEMQRVEAFVVIDPADMSNGVAEVTFELSFATGAPQRHSFPLLGPTGPTQTR